MTLQFNRFFKRQSLASTYKPTFVKCLLDLGDYGESEGSEWVKENGSDFVVDLNFVASRFIRYYHPLKFKFKLKQEATTKRIAVYRILEEFEKQLGVKSTPTKKLLCSKKFADLRQKTINEGIKPQVLKKLLNDCALYAINKGSNSINIKKDTVEFMKENKNVLEAALNYMIAKYLESCNVSPNISTKLQEKIPRNKLDKDIFTQIISLQESHCFYCKNEFKSFVQEHFIPWNYIFHTEKFNIVAACNDCNSSKHDKLPDNKYLQILLDRNRTLDNLSIGYSDEFMQNLYDTCKIEYHGTNKEPWKI